MLCSSNCMLTGFIREVIDGSDGVSQSQPFPEVLGVACNVVCVSLITLRREWQLSQSQPWPGGLGVFCESFHYEQSSRNTTITRIGLCSRKLRNGNCGGWRQWPSTHCSMWSLCRFMTRVTIDGFDVNDTRSNWRVWWLAIREVIDGFDGWWYEK